MLDPQYVGKEEVAKKKAKGNITYILWQIDIVVIDGVTYQAHTLRGIFDKPLTAESARSKLVDSDLQRGITGRIYDIEDTIKNHIYAYTSLLVKVP